MHESEKSKWGRSVVSYPQWPHGLQPSRFLHPWDFPCRSTGVGCHFLLGIHMRSSFFSPCNIRCSKAGVPILWAGDSTSCWISDSVRSEINCTIKLMCVNHPETIPHPRSVERLSSTKPVPGAKKVGDRCSEFYFVLTLIWPAQVSFSIWKNRFSFHF